MDTEMQEQTPCIGISGNAVIGVCSNNSHSRSDLITPCMDTEMQEKTPCIGISGNAVFGVCANNPCSRSNLITPCMDTEMQEQTPCIGYFYKSTRENLTLLLQVIDLAPAVQRDWSLLQQPMLQVGFDYAMHGHRDAGASAFGGLALRPDTSGSAYRIKDG